MSFLDIESTLDYKYIVGIDEVGRGCFMGPMVVGFCFYNPSLQSIADLTDSKKLTAAKRTKIAPEIASKAKFLLVSIDSSFLDLYGLNMAYLYAAKRFCRYFNLNLEETYFLSDYGIKLPREFNARHFKSGDSLCYCIAAASVLAKVYRDNVMTGLELLHPNFSSSSHKGFGSKAHRDKIAELGPSKAHRLSFLKNV